MSKVGKIGFLVAALCFVVVTAIRFILGVWLPVLYILLAFAAIAFVISILSDRRLYLEFLTLRTTKHGMNMGALILLVLVLIVCVNYISVRHNKTWDLTSEQLNSLSDQSKKVLAGLNADAEFKVFFKGTDALEDRQRIRQALSIFQENSSKVKVRYIDSYVENALAQEYLAALPDKDQEAAFAFIDIEGKRIRIDSPYGEEQITSALIKASRRSEKKIYFLTGHMERELTSESQQGLQGFYNELISASYKPEELSLVDKASVPEDAGLVAIVGPKAPLLDSEISVLKEYLKKGGRLLIAVDPGERHNLSQLTRAIGVDFKNNFIINLDPLTRQASGTAIGVDFDPQHPVTTAFPIGKTLTLFDLASELGRDPSLPESIKLVELVKTSPMSFVLKEIKSQVPPPKEQKSFPLMIAASGKLEDGTQDFNVIVSGDSDYLTNRLFLVGSNRDLAMNSLASLTDQSDLISVRPKQAKNTQMILTSGSRLGMIMAGISLPIFLLLLSGVFWFRRRGA